jgi:hypothetical protein
LWETERAAFIFVSLFIAHLLCRCFHGPEHERQGRSFRPSRRLSRGPRYRGRFRFRAASLAQTKLRSGRQSCYCPCLFLKVVELSERKSPTDETVCVLRRMICQSQK